MPGSLRATFCALASAAVLACRVGTEPNRRVPPPTGYFRIIATGISAANRSIAGFNKRREFAGDDSRSVFRVAAGVEHALQIAADADQAFAIAVNENGDVAGFDRLFLQADRILKWPGTSDAGDAMQFVGSRPVDMNDAGDVLLSVVAYSPVLERDTAFYLWTPKGIETISTLGILGGTGHTTVPTAMNNAREVLGWTQQFGRVTAVLIPRVARPLPKSPCNFTVSKLNTYPVALNDSGAYVIQQPDEFAGSQIVVRREFCLISPNDSSVVLSFSVATHGLNNNGWLFGTRLDPDGVMRSVVSIRGRNAVSVDSLFATDGNRAGWTIEKVVALNDNNELLAVATKNGAREFVILAPAFAND